MVEDCQNSFDLAIHPLFQAFQWYTFVVLIPGMAALMYLIVKKLIFSSFHGNLKFVMIGYFGSVFVLATYYEIITIYTLIHINITRSPCDVIIGKILFKYGHLIAIIVLTTPMLFPLAISIERCIAVQNAAKYEYFKIIIGPALLVLTIFTDILIVSFIYKDEPFEEGFISFIFIPSTTGLRMFTFYWVLFFMNIINFIFNTTLLKINRKLRKKYAAHLNVRFQLEHVVLSTKFSVSVIFFHLMFFGGYVALVIAVRYHGYLIFSDPVTLTAARSAVIGVIPTYISIIGFVAVYLYYNINAKKVLEIRSNIGMEYTGANGAKIHDQAIFSIWNSASIK